MNHKITTAAFLVLLSLGCSKQNYNLADANTSFDSTVTYNNKVDIILMIDNSSSMLQYQNKFATEVPAMLQALVAQGMDFHIAVVTTDIRTKGNGGMFVGSQKFVTNATPNLTAILSASVLQGQAGSDLEQGVESIRRVLSPSYLAGDGQGFLRDSAFLAIIALSNEDDSSPDTAASFGQYLDQVKAKYVGVGKAWSMNFIGVPSLASSCSTVLGGEYKEPGLKWIDLANQSSGRVEPICDTTLAKGVSNVRQRIQEIITEYSLGRKPKVETIVVHKNGQLVPQSNTDGWEYIPDGYIVRLHGSYLPTSTEKIDVDFSPAEAL